MQGNDTPPAGGGGGESGHNANIYYIYILYLAGIVTGLLALIGVIIAYVSRNDSDGWANDHRSLQIRTFWIGALYWGVGFAALAFAVVLDPWLFFIPVPGPFSLIVLVAMFVGPWLSPVACLLFLAWVQLVTWTKMDSVKSIQSLEWWLWTLLTALLVWGLFWWTKRCVRGLRYLFRQEPHPNPRTWLW